MQQPETSQGPVSRGEATILARFARRARKATRQALSNGTFVLF